MSGYEEETARIIQRIRWWRVQRKLTQQVVADRAGIDRTYLSKIESGHARLDSRSTIDAIARALDVSYAELTGQPVRPDTPELQAANMAIGRIRSAYLASDLHDGADAPPRPLAAIEQEVDAAAEAWQECDYGAAGRPLGWVLSELHAHAVGPERAQALPLLVRALDTAAWTARVLGYYDLAHGLAGRELEAANLAGDPTLVGLAHFTRTLMVAAAGSGDEAVRAVSRRGAERAIAELTPRASAPAALEVLGMLHLAAARADLAAGGDAEAPLTEAERLAERTGEGTAFRLYFGPTNVAIWRVHVAEELRQGGRAAEIARGVRPAAIPSKARRSMYYRHLGLALAQESGREAEAVTALLRAERTAPGKLRLDPLAKHTVEHMLDRARASAGGDDLLALARYVGVL
jgi:transcriptional regulator with XRE-family HTH domain